MTSCKPTRQQDKYHIDNAKADARECSLPHQSSLSAIS